jgi:UDP-N-acetylmuramoyl-tripeptide--D-alanyl-D-alanine ligase
MALEKGAGAVLCTHAEGDYPAIIVDDTRIALGEIARNERQRLGMKAVAVTGSVGKSTTKEMIATVLDGTYKVAKTPVNHNNDIGMPMAILAMPEDTEVAVLEMGMNHFREIAYLTNIGKPDVAVVVNIGTMHIEHLGSQAGILQAKLEIREGMDQDGVLILNGDDNLLWNQKLVTDIRRVHFGVNNPDATVAGSDVKEEDSGLKFAVRAGEKEFAVKLPLSGLHYVSDALAAIAVGLEMGVEPADIQARLAAFQNMEGRQSIYEAKGFTIINDSYNAGPESMAAALNVLGSRQGRRIAVLGDMLELGVNTEAEHYKIGRIAAEKADFLFAYGPTSERMLNGAVTGGMAGKARAFTDRDRLIQILKLTAQPGDVLLFKGSRGMRMELILEGFLRD